METHFRQYKIFVSSPGDVQKERQLVDEIVNRINLTLGDSLKVNLQVVRWEKMPPETTEESIQEGLNRKIAECNFFLLILNKRYGSIEKGFTISNTEREINTILSYTKQQKKKKNIVLFPQTQIQWRSWRTGDENFEITETTFGKQLAL